MKSREISPATITMAKGFCVSEPMPVESAAGSNPRQATRAVIMIGRRRSSEAVRVAVCDIHSLLPQLVDIRNQNDGGLNRDAQQRQQSQTPTTR